MKYLIAATSWTLLIVYLLLIRVPSQVPELTFTIPHFDKLVHATLFFVAGYLYIKTFETYFKKSTHSKISFWVLGLLISFAIITELMQNFWTTYRTGSIGDASADIIGGSVSILFSKKIDFFSKRFGILK